MPRRRAHALLVLVPPALVATLPCPARAEHGDPMMVPAPRPGTVLPRNARIRLESHNGIHFLVEGLGRHERGFAAALVAADHQVLLRVERFFDDREGGYGDGLLVLAPRRLLRPETRYQLELRYPGEDGKPQRWTEWEWSTGREIAREPPVWDGPATRSAATAAILAPVVTLSPLVQIDADAVPVGGGGKRMRLSAVFDLTRACGGGPTVDYDQAIYNSSCAEAAADGLCQTACFFGTSTLHGKAVRVSLTAIDLAGLRARAPGPPVVTTWTEDECLAVCLPPVSAAR